MREIDTSEFHARRFNEQCRRDARMFPRPHIDEVVRDRVTRIVSRDFISGSCDAFDPFDSETPALLRRQAS